jgi:hypothetical protein
LSSQPQDRKAMDSEAAAREEAQRKARAKVKAEKK